MKPISSNSSINRAIRALPISWCTISRPRNQDVGLDLVALFQEPDDVVLLELVIVLIRVGAKLNFLDVDALLVFFRFVSLLLHLVAVLAVIHDPAHRRDRLRCYLYQVETAFFRGSNRRLWRHDSELGSVLVDYTDLSGANSVIDARLIYKALTSGESLHF